MTRRSFVSLVGRASVVCGLVLGASAVHGPAMLSAQMTAAAKAPTVAAGLIPAETMEKLLPATVWFSGQSAPLQLRNSAGFRSGAGHTLWAGLVDTSGYSTGVREKYQFYFVTEFPVKAGALDIAPGVYGGGFLADNTFVLLDVSGAEIGRTRLENDAALRRPRPLQMAANGSVVRLYLGRQYLSLAPR